VGADSLEDSAKPGISAASTDGNGLSDSVRSRLPSPCPEKGAFEVSEFSEAPDGGLMIS